MILDLLIILDRSGSMADRRTDHEGGLRSFVQDQRDLEGDVRLTFVQFDSVNPCEIVYDRVPLDKVDRIELIPRGWTPLLDAMGTAMAHLSKQNPEEVICLVVTDGQENASHEWTKARVATRVKELEAANWKFLYLGANVDAFNEAAAVGIGGANAMNFSHASGQTVSSVYAASASNVRGYRRARAGGQSVAAASVNLNYTAGQRNAAMGTDENDVPVTTSTTDDKE